MEEKNGGKGNGREQNGQVIGYGWEERGRGREKSGVELWGKTK